MFVNKNNQYSIECQKKSATDCIHTGVYFDTKVEAEEWVEGECWIDSGEGWICNKCHDQLMGSLKSHRRSQGNGLNGVNSDLEAFDGLDNELETGIDIVR